MKRLPFAAAARLGISLVLAPLVLACAPPSSSSPDAGAADPLPSGTLRVVTGETATGFADGQGRAARFAGITCLELSGDGDTLYVADTFNGTVRALDTSDGTVTTLAGAAQQLATSDGSGAEARFTAPRGLGLSPDGATLYVADGPTLRSVDVASAAVTLAVGVASEDGFVDGSPLEARLGYLLHDLAVSADGQRVLIADRSNDVIRAMDVASESVSTLAGGGEPGSDGVGASAGFNGPGGLSLADDVLYVADTFSHTVRALELATTTVSTVVGQRDQAGDSDGALAEALLDAPQGVTRAGEVLFAAGFGGALRRIDLALGEVSTPVGVASDAAALDGDASSARLGGAFASPVADAAAGKLYYADLEADSVRVIDLESYDVSTLAGPVAPRGFVDGALAEARFQKLYGVAASADGTRLYLADPDNGAVRVVDRVGGLVTTLAGDWQAPVGLELDEEGQRLFVTDAGGGQLFVVTLADGAATALGDAQYEAPWDVVYDGESSLYVSDYEGAAVFRVDVTSGASERLAGSGAPGSTDGVGAAASFDGPVGIAYDAAGGRLFVADFNASTLRSVDVGSGEVTTLAGRAGEAAHRDGADARFNGPSGIALVNGALLVADTLNHVVRRVDVDSGEAHTVLGDAARPGNLGFGAERGALEATLYDPEALAPSDAGLFVVAEQALLLLDSLPGEGE